MGNIIGEGFNQTIVSQIEKRQEIYGSKTRDNSINTFLNSRTGWVRMGSSVDVEIDARNLGLLANELAKEYVLFNGVSRFESKIPTQRSGIVSSSVSGSDSVTPLHGNFAYGIGGNEQGLTPMPGIVAMSTKTETRGSLKTSTIQIKCHNRVQFDIIDTLYLRLGFTMLLEWGHSSYYQNDGTHIPDNEFTLMDSFLGLKGAKPIKYSTYYEYINKLRLDSNGNYDALLGKVVNFNWTFNKDGSYDVTVILRSMGDVIESLRTNILLGDKFNTGLDRAYEVVEQSEKERDKIYKSSNTSAAAYDVGAFPAESTSNQQVLNDQYAEFNEQLNVKKALDAIKQFEEKKANAEAIGQAGVYANRDANSLGRWIYDNIILFDTLAANNAGITRITGRNAKNEKITSYIRQEYENGVPPHYFIHFGRLLDWISTNIVPDVEKQKLFFIDTDAETNLIILAARQYPTDNRVCQVSYSNEFSNGVIMKYLPKGEEFEKERGENRYGKLMNIYFNIDFVLSCLSNNVVEGKVALIDFINSLCNGWNDSTGNYSKIEPTFVEETNTLRIIDTNPLPDRDYFLENLYNPPISTKLAAFDIYGYYIPEKGNQTSGFITDFSFETSISPNLATMITIGANSNGQITGEDATGVSRMNNGFADRIKPIITSPGITDEEADKAEEESTEKNYTQTLKNLGAFLQEIGSPNGEGKPTFNPENVSAFKTCVQTIIEFDQSKKTQLKNETEDENSTEGLKYNKYATASSGFLPFNLSLTMDGLSGMRVYQKFITDTSFLPSNYPNSLEFLISGVEHSIIGNKWETKINSIAVPKNPFSPKSDTKLESVEGRKRNNNTNYDNSSRGTNQDYGDTNVTITSGFPLKPTAYQAKEFEKSQIFLHYSAGWQLTDKGLQTIQFLNNRDQTKAGGDQKGLSYHYIIDGAGHNEQIMNNKYRAFHAGNANSPSIGISLQNIGFKSSSNTNADGTLKQPNQSPMVKLVGFDGKPSPYKGHTYGQEITDAQYNTLLSLFKKLQSEHSSIPKFIFNQENWNRLFPKKGTTSWKIDKPGWYTHNSSDTGKSDMLPTPKIRKLYLNLAGNTGNTGDNGDIFNPTRPKEEESLRALSDLNSRIIEIFNLRDNEGKNGGHLFSPYSGGILNDNEEGARDAFNKWLSQPSIQKQIYKIQEPNLANFKAWLLLIRTNMINKKGVVYYFYINEYGGKTKVSVNTDF